MPPRGRRHAKTHVAPVARTGHDTVFVGSPSDAELIFIGPVGVGKTTAGVSVSVTEPISAEAALTRPRHAVGFLAELESKVTTTVGIDYGMVRLPDGRVIGLFGTAGQERFRWSRGPLFNPTARIVIWVNGADGNLELQVLRWIARGGGRPRAHQMTIAINFAHAHDTEEVRAVLRKHRYPDIPVKAVDPRRADQVMDLISAAVGYSSPEVKTDE